MKNTYLSQSKFRALVLFSLILVMVSLACGLGDIVQISIGNPTPTRTRTPRPTFTPRVELTATPEDTATPTFTETPAATGTTTRRPTSPPAIVVRTATKPPVVQPTALPIQLVVSYPCHDPGGAVWEVIGSIRRPSSIWLENYVLAILSPSGKILKTQVSVSDEAKVNALDISCQRSGVLPYNVKIDAGDIRTAGQVIIRIIRSASDPTPLSPSVTADFSSPVRWFLFYDVP